MTSPNWPGASGGQFWGNPAGYLGDVLLEDFDIYGLSAGFDIRYCMGGVTVQNFTISGGGSGLYCYDCGEGKIAQGRIENMSGVSITVEGNPNGLDHSAEDFQIEGLTCNVGRGAGIVWKNQGFGTIVGSDITSCSLGPAVNLWALVPISAFRPRC